MSKWLDIPAQLNSSACLSAARFLHFHALEDLYDAISSLRRAIELTGVGKEGDLTVLLGNLGQLLVLSFKHTEDLSDLSEGVAAMRRATLSGSNKMAHGLRPVVGRLRRIAL